VRSALRVGLRVTRLSGGRKRLQGSVSPRVPRGRASLQKRSPSGRWITVRRAGVHPLRGARSRYRFTVSRAGTYRVVVAGNTLGSIRPLSRDAVAALTADLKPKQVQTEDTPDELSIPLMAREQGRAVVLATSRGPLSNLTPGRIAVLHAITPPHEQM